MSMLLFRRNWNISKSPIPPYKQKKPGMKLKNIYLALKDQGPFKRFMRNLFKGHLIGLISKRSHVNANGKPKVMYNTKASAVKSCSILRKKKGCLLQQLQMHALRRLPHIGKNSDNKIGPPVDNSDLNALLAKATEKAQRES